MTETHIVGFLVFVFGTVVGSFLNVCIVRLPQEKSIVFPNSHCVHCKTPIMWYDNVPLLSYLFLGGKCRSCKKSISYRYFLVELVTGLAFLKFYLYFGLTPVYFSYLVMVSGFIVATFVDMEHRIIPDEISVGGMIVGVILSLFIPALHSGQLANIAVGRIVVWSLSGAVIWMTLLMTVLPAKKEETDTTEEKNSGDERSEMLKFFGFIVCVLILEVILNFFGFRFSGALKAHLLSLDSALVGLIIGGGSIYLMGLLGDLIFRKESMGGGDVKLMAMIGAFMGWKLALLTFFIAPFFGAVWGVIEKIRTKDSAIAYGPFIVIGALISLFRGDEIINWIMSGYGLY